METKQDEYVKLLDTAWALGMEAGRALKPTPMAIEGYPVVEDGVCGFAWVRLKMNNPLGRFIGSQIPKGDQFCEFRGWRRSTEGGLIFWIISFNQSMQRKEAFARAYADELRACGFDATPYSRMD